jgi:hypothetical protein
VPILYGYPSEQGLAKVWAGLLVLGGCEVGSGRDGFACPRHRRWLGQGEVPTELAPLEASASRMYVAGDFGGAGRAYRAALEVAAQRRGERDPDTRALRHALAIVLSAAGQAEDAEAVYAPLRAMEHEEMFARRQELRRRLPTRPGVRGAGRGTWG